MESPKADYLKYWRVIRYYFKHKYGLTQVELDMLLFLYSEQYFSRDKFNEYDEICGWDKERFNKLLRNGWIEVFRKQSGRNRAIYQLSYKTKRMIISLYKKLNGEEIPVTLQNNKMFKKNVSYTDKVYRNLIKEMNMAIQRPRHRPRE